MSSYLLAFIIAMELGGPGLCDGDECYGVTMNAVVWTPEVADAAWGLS